MFDDGTVYLLSMFICVLPLPIYIYFNIKHKGDYDDEVCLFLLVAVIGIVPLMGTIMAIGMVYAICRTIWETLLSWVR